MLSFFILALSAPVFAGQPNETNSCAKIALSAIYGAERSYESEYERFSDSFADIGYAPEPGKCVTWSASLRLFDGGREFLATAVKSDTGETWTINQRKELRQENEGRRPAP